MTRAEAETDLVSRLKVLMTAANMTVTVAGSNAALNDPFRTALRQMGESFADLSDAIETLAEEQHYEFLLRAEIRLLRNMLGNIEGSDLSMTTGKSEQRSQLVDQINSMLKTAMADLEGLATVESEESGIEGGMLALDFEEQLSWQAL